MALTYRSPIEEVLTLLEPAAQSLIAATATASYQQNEKENFQWFNYSVPAVAKEHLSQAGIYLSPYSGYPHSHPTCKILENYMLYKVLPGIINNSFYFVGIKQFKLNFIKKRHKNLSLLSSINRYVSSADKIRYGNEFVVKCSSENRQLKRHTSLNDSATLKDLSPNIKTGANLFFHDELHYWHKDDLITFLEVCKPEIMLGTIVYPTEVFSGATHSLNAWCYEFEIKKGRLLFYPDGVRTEGYDQPLNGGYLLKCNRILLPDGTVYCVDVVSSKFAHHLVSITRGQLVVPQYRSFGPFDAVHIGALKDVSRGARECIPVTLNNILRVYRYLRSLKKPDKQSAMAKYSQLTSDPSGESIKFMEEFSDLVITTGSVRTMLKAESIKLFFGNIGRQLPSVLASKLASANAVCLDEFITMLKPLSVDIELMQMSKSTLFSVILEQGEAEEGTDPVGNLSRKWEGESPFERIRAPYIGLAPLADNAHIWKIEVNTSGLLHGLGEMHVKANFSATKGFSCDLWEYVHRIYDRVPLTGRAYLNALTEEECAHYQRYLNNVVFYEHSWYTGREIWFLRSRGRSHVHYLDSPQHVSYRQEFEYTTHSRPIVASRFTFIPCGEDDLYDDCANYSEAVAPSTSEHEPAEQWSGGYKEGGHHRTIECKCGVEFEISELVFNEECPIAFTDTLKGRQAAWYSINNARYVYNGGKHESKGWPKWLSLWMQVNNVPSKYNCVLAQKYSKNTSIGFHSDDEPLFKKGESILTVNLVGAAKFGIKCCATTWFDLKAGTKFEMPMGFQESHRHSVKDTDEGRVSLTFRVLAEMNAESGKSEASEDGEASAADPSSFFEEEVVVHSSKMEKVPDCKIIPNSGGGDCFWLALSYFTGVSVEAMKSALMQANKPEIGSKLWEQLQDKTYTEDEAIMAACRQFGFDIRVYDLAQMGVLSFEFEGNNMTAVMKQSEAHFEAMVPKELCTVRALAACLKRRDTEVHSYLMRHMGSEFQESMLAGKGFTLGQFGDMALLLGVDATVENDGEHFKFQNAGLVQGLFKFENGHATFVDQRLRSAHVQTNVHANEVTVSDADLTPLREICSQIKYKPEIPRAKVLSDSLLQGTTGVLCSELFNNMGPILSKAPKLAARNLGFILGVFGCGKSYAVRSVLERAVGKAVIYVSPRKFLADQFDNFVQTLKVLKGEQHVKNFKSFTFEKALIHCNKFVPGSLVILDEVQLFPPGYLDLMLTTLHEDTHTYCLGDPCQSDYDSEKDRGILSALGSDVAHILERQEYKYNVMSKRFQGRMFEGRLPCMHAQAPELENRLKLLSSLEQVDCKASSSGVCLVSSFEEKKIVNAFFGSKCKTYTFGESTGANFDEGSILLTGASLFTSENRWVTALSRFRKSVVIVNATGLDWDLVQKQYEGRTFGRFLARKAKADDLQALLPGNPTFTEGFKIQKFGADEEKRELKLQGDPWLKTMIDLLQVEDQEIVEEAEVVLQDEWFKTHLPQCELESVRARWVHKIMAKEFREKRMGYLVSEQFTDEHSKQLGKQLTNAAERFEAIYPRHRAADTVTFVMAVRKRLRFSDPIKEAAKLSQAMPYGPFLLKEFLKHVPLKPMHNTLMMEEAKFEFEEKKTSKSAATIENHSNRSMKEWAIDIGLVFSKSQLCTKFDNRFRDAKAAQTIVCFQHAVLCRFAPYMRYIEKKVNEVLPEKFYIHSGKGLEELNDWVKRGIFDGTCTESDYEAFDASQDQYIVAFEICVMRFLGLPNDLIEDYKFIKTHLGSKLGSFAIMRFSGEASTFLFNTMANMLFTFLKYDLMGNERICFAGDDMCSNTRLHVSGKHIGFLKKLKLKAKVANTRNPTFCGWCLCPDGIFKKPQLVLERLCIAKETNNLQNCIDNYALEVAFAYKMGELAIARMNEEEIDAFYNCVRMIIKNKHLLKSDVRLTYEAGLVM